MLKLYHVPYALCAQKVRLCLAEKDVHWEAIDVTRALRSPEYLALNPRGYVPTLVHDDFVLTESRVINEYVDDAFPGPALQPQDLRCRATMRLWSKQIDDSLHLSIFVLSCAAFFRDSWLAMPQRDRERTLPTDPLKHERAVSLLSLGWDSPYIIDALCRFSVLTKDMERQLSTHPWLAGGCYSLADVDYTPYLQRLTDLGLNWLWDDCSATTDWFHRVRERPSFAEVLQAWVPPETRADHIKAAGAADCHFRTLYERSSVRPA